MRGKVRRREEDVKAQQTSDIRPSGPHRVEGRSESSTGRSVLACSSEMTWKAMSARRKKRRTDEDALRRKVNSRHTVLPPRVLRDGNESDDDLLSGPFRLSNDGDEVRRRRGIRGDATDWGPVALDSNDMLLERGATAREEITSVEVESIRAEDGPEREEQGETNACSLYWIVCRWMTEGTGGMARWTRGSN